MADNKGLGDYGNFWSADYWNSKAKAQRDADRAASSHKLAQEQNAANVRDWGNVGNALGVKPGIDWLISRTGDGKRSAPKQAVGGGSSFHWPAGEQSLSPMQSDYSAPSANGGTRQGADDIPSSVYRDGPGPQSPLEILMEKLGQPYQGPDAKALNFSSLDKALQMRLGAIGQARNQINGNFDKSDLAIQQMHDAFKHEVETKDAARYNKISDTQESGLKNNLKMSTDNLAGQRAAYLAERQAMLKNLGQEAVATDPHDPNVATFNDGIATATRRNGIDMRAAEEGRATNQAYNVGVAQSIGQAGVQRRSALQQQLQGLLGKVSMAETEAKAQDQAQRQQMISGVNDTAYKHWNDQQNRYQDLFNILTDESVARDKMSMGDATKPVGMGAIAQGLIQNGVDPNEAANGIAILNRVLSGGNYLDHANGADGNQPYDKQAVLAQKLRNEQMDPGMATQIALLYGKL